jgi:Radical SAM superfamily/Condensation domain
VNNDPQKNILLLLPPFYTPFTPPLGISILKAYLEQHGYSVTCFDFNTVPHLWVMHHKYFEALRKLEGITVYQGYTNLWYVLQAHMLAHLNAGNSSGCAKLLSIVLPIYGIKPETRVIHSLIGIVSTFFRDLEQEISTRFDLTQFSVVGTSTYSTSLAASLFLHKLIKRKYPQIKTVMGGGVFADDLADGSANLETLKTEYPEVDHIVLGEGELLFRDILEGKHGDTRVLKISDVGRTTLDMRDVPIPDYTDFNLNDYLHLCIEGARSCPFQCSFCSETIQWGEYRKKPLGTLAKQMIHLANRYDNHTFYMGDSLMNPYIEDLCGSLLKEKSGILYDGYLRADRIATHRDRVRRWARSGLVRARLGIESASLRVLDAMDKKTTPEGISEVLKSLANAGIRTTTLWIVGFPGETEQDFQDTLDFIREHHRFIYELDVHYYYYYPYGQVSSRLYQSYPMYPEEVRKAVKFQQWEIIDANPTREEKFDRLVRMNDLAIKLGIPNLHTLEQRYAAERRWQQLFPLTRDVFQGAKTKRSVVELRNESLPVFSEQWTNRSDATLCYRVSVRKALDETILADAVGELVKHNQMLQVDLRDGRYVAAAGDNSDLLSVVQYSGDDVAAVADRLINKTSSELRPQRGASVKVVLMTKEDETCELLFNAHRAIVDSRSVVLLVEDLFRIYEQLSEEREISLRPAMLSYGEAASQICDGAVRAEGISRPALPARGSSKSRTVKLGRNLSSAAERYGLKPVDVVFGSLLASLARASGKETLVLDAVCDYRYVDDKLKDTVGPLTACYQLAVEFSPEEKLLATIERVRSGLKESVLTNRQSFEQADILVNLEYMLDEAWLGGDTWLPGGFVTSRSNDYTALEIVPIQNSEDAEIIFRFKGEAMESLVDAVEALLVGQENIFSEIDSAAEEKPQVTEYFILNKPIVSRFLSGKRKAISLSQVS